MAERWEMCTFGLRDKGLENMGTIGLFFSGYFQREGWRRQVLQAEVPAPDDPKGYRVVASSREFDLSGYSHDLVRAMSELTQDLLNQGWKELGDVEDWTLPSYKKKRFRRSVSDDQ